MYSSQFYDQVGPDVHISAIHHIPQNITNIRHGLNGPASIVQNDVHMAQANNHPPVLPRAPKQEKERINVLAIPSSTVVGSQVIIGDAASMSQRSYTPVKGVGDGSFGTVWLCDWHTPLPPSVSLAPMQQGAGAKPEWQGKRLVAIKRMKKRWEGGWDECRRHPELESLRTIPAHENVIPLYDCFLLPSSRELYFVFECMEGNLYQLIKSRKGRPLAGGLVSSIFHQTCKGLAHVHDAGYFHRDMKPENLLVTTTGLADYTAFSPLAPPGAPPEKDVVVIIKLADFGLARLIKSKPPYTEYVSTRWYRAPEVLLQSTDYGAPVDLWALGTIMAEVVNLKPLFPGTNGPDQLLRICQILGDPSDIYGFDSHGRQRGGGKWSKGLKMAKQIGITFEKIQPLDFFSLFDPSVPHSLIDCIHSLLRYEPDARLTAHACLEHAYFVETAPRVMYPPLNMPRRHLSSAGSGSQPPTSSRNGVLASVSPRSIPPSHSHSAARHHSHHHHHPYSNGTTNNSHRQPFVPQQVHSLGGSDTDMTPADGVIEVDRNNNPVRRHHSHQYRQQQNAPDRMVIDPQTDMNNASSKSGVFGLSKKLGSMFHQDKTLAPVEEIMYTSRSTPSLKDTPSTSLDSRSLPEAYGVPSLLPMPPPVPVPPPMLPPMDPKKLKKEQERQEREAEKEKRAIAERLQKERARAVMAKRNQLPQARNADFEYQSVNAGRLAVGNPRPKTRKSKEETSVFGNGIVPPSVVAANSYGTESQKGSINGSRQQRSIQLSNSITPLLGVGAYDYRKRRKDEDDELSMSSSDVQSIGRMSMISFATVDSDPGPGRSLRRRQSAYNYGLSPRPLGTASSISSLQSYSNSPRSSHSVEPGSRPNGSLDTQFVGDFETRATLAAVSGAPLYSPAVPLPHPIQSAPSPGQYETYDSMSPPSMQFLTLSGSPSNQPWSLESGSVSPLEDGNSVSTLGSRRLGSLHGRSPGHHPSPSFEYFSPNRSHPPTPHSGMNSAFEVPPPVPPLPATSHLTSAASLPSFASLVSIVDMQGLPQTLEVQPMPGQPP
ncbi:hypothetical protein FRC15_010352 [Serendipita sp. 397]|nr:hypothetical protein FRC15_010352 [Serendipita sp. 397]